MKTPEEWFQLMASGKLIPDNPQTEGDMVIPAIIAIQKDAYNQGVEDTEKLYDSPE